MIIHEVKIPKKHATDAQSAPTWTIKLPAPKPEPPLRSAFEFERIEDFDRQQPEREIAHRI